MVARATLRGWTRRGLSAHTYATALRSSSTISDTPNVVGNRGHRRAAVSHRQSPDRGRSTIRSAGWDRRACWILEDPKLRLRVQALIAVVQDATARRRMALYGYVKRLPLARRFKLRAAHRARGVRRRQRRCARQGDAAGGDAAHRRLPARIRLVMLSGEILRGISRRHDAGGPADRGDLAARALAAHRHLHLRRRPAWPPRASACGTAAGSGATAST